MNDGPKIEELSGTRVRIVKTGTAVNKVDNFLQQRETSTAAATGPV